MEAFFFHIKGDTYRKLARELDGLPKVVDGKLTTQPFGSWWYTRIDKQNVPDAKVPFTEKVEGLIRAKGDEKMADQIATFRLFFEAFDKSGISEADRIDHIVEFLMMIEEVLLEPIYDGRGHKGAFGHQHFPLSEKKVGGEDSGAGDEEGWKCGSIPREVLQELFILAYYYLNLDNNLLNLKINRDYNESELPRHLPLFIARFFSSMDVESKFSVFNEFMGNLGRHVKGKANTEDAARNMEKIIIVEGQDYQARTFRNSAYEPEEIINEKEKWYGWITEIAGKVSRGDMRGTLFRQESSEKRTGNGHSDYRRVASFFRQKQ